MVLCGGILLALVLAGYRGALMGGTVDGVINDAQTPFVLRGVEGRKHRDLDKDCANHPSSVHPERSRRALRVNGDCTHQTH